MDTVNDVSEETVGQIFSAKPKISIRNVDVFYGVNYCSMRAMFRHRISISSRLGRELVWSFRSLIRSLSQFMTMSPMVRAKIHGLAAANIELDGIVEDALTKADLWCELKERLVLSLALVCLAASSGYVLHAQ